jgi:S-(hydroxymethyl)glutathione dehydrogenase/alcohol dehydrogenase
VTEASHVGEAFGSIRKAGTCVVVSLGNPLDNANVPISLYELVLFQKRLQGSLFGASSATKDIPALLSLYRRGQLKLDELITIRYSLDQINEGYADIHAGRNIRGVIVFD